MVSFGGTNQALAQLTSLPADSASDPNSPAVFGPWTPNLKPCACWQVCPQRPAAAGWRAARPRCSSVGCRPSCQEDWAGG